MPSWEGAAVLSSEPGPQAVVALGATVDGTLGSSQGLVQSSRLSAVATMRCGPWSHIESPYWAE